MKWQLLSISKDFQYFRKTAPNIWRAGVELSRCHIFASILLCAVSTANMTTSEHENLTTSRLIFRLNSTKNESLRKKNLKILLDRCKRLNNRRNLCLS